ncbi:MAG: hypothetical protein JWQ09_3898 [Segetibacter sp.]|nr:hypothetical protein [Segetibacter sp.]
MTLQCVLCNGVANRTFEGLKGYSEGMLFDVYECGSCLATFVDPLKVDSQLYNDIYRQVEKMPGYERYYRYSKLVKQFNNPLKMLADSESVYWAVQETLRKQFPTKNISVLEIASGLGYLTYSLNKAGYKATGLDISKEAVQAANTRYGDYYEAGDLFVVAKNSTKKYDCVIMTELIEHVESPKAFVEAALSLLKEGGRLILSTPNKNIAPRGTVWQSDVPPVHLWWLAEESVSKLASTLGRKCEFVDFTEYTKKFYEDKAVVPIERINAFLPRMDKENNLLLRFEDRSFKARYMSPKLRYVLSYIRRRLKVKQTTSRSSTMCVVLS